MLRPSLHRLQSSPRPHPHLCRQKEEEAEEAEKLCFIYSVCVCLSVLALSESRRRRAFGAAAHKNSEVSDILHRRARFTFNFLFLFPFALLRPAPRTLTSWVGAEDGAVDGAPQRESREEGGGRPRYLVSRTLDQAWRHRSFPTSVLRLSTVYGTDDGSPFIFCQWVPLGLIRTATQPMRIGWRRVHAFQLRPSFFRLNCTTLLQMTSSDAYNSMASRRNGSCLISKTFVVHLCQTLSPIKSIRTTRLACFEHSKHRAKLASASFLSQ